MGNKRSSPAPSSASLPCKEEDRLSTRDPSEEENEEIYLCCGSSMRLRRAFQRRLASCSKCHDNFGRSEQFSFDTLPNNAIRDALRYLSATEAIYLEAVCTKMSAVLLEGSWCETLILDELWRTPPGNDPQVRKKWFPKFAQVKVIRHPREGSRVIKKSDDDKSLPSTASTKSALSPKLQQADASKRKWNDLLPVQLAPLLRACNESLEALEVHYVGNWEGYRLRPIPDIIQMKHLQRMTFKLESKNDTLAIDCEDLIVSLRNVQLFECVSVEIGGTKQANHFIGERRKGDKGDIVANDCHGAHGMIVEAFGNMLTKQEGLDFLSVKMTVADAELLADVLPFVLEV